MAGVKLTGKLLILLAFLWLGGERMLWYQKRCSLLSDLIGSVQIMISELTSRETDTVTLLRLAGEGERACAAFFLRCAEEAERMEEGSFSCLWDRSLENAKLPLGDWERRLLSRAGQIIGRYDGREQARLLTALNCQLERCLVLAREEEKERGKLALTLSCCAGLMLILLL